MAGYGGPLNQCCIVASTRHLHTGTRQVRIGIQIKTWRAAFNLEFPTVAKPCITCHGLDGRGRSPGFPNLCGQKSIYMMQQLTMFRDKKRQSGHCHVNRIYSEIVVTR